MRFDYAGCTFEIQGLSEQDHIYATIIKRGAFYELDLLEYIRLLKGFEPDPHAVAIDVGANIGNHSVFFGTFLVGHVISVEPNPAVLPTLKANLSANLHSYTLHEAALASRAGKGRIELPQTSANNVGMAQVRLDAGAGTVPVDTLDDVITSWKAKRKGPARITLLKIDVEGMELEVLRGATQALQNDRPDVFVEANSDKELAGLELFLKNYDYQKISRWGATPMYHFAPDPTRMYQLRALGAKIQARLRKQTRKLFSRKAP